MVFLLLGYVHEFVCDGTLALIGLHISWNHDREEFIMVDFSDTPEQAGWRAVVQEFIDSKLPKELQEDQYYAGSLGGMHRGPLGNSKRVQVMKSWRKEILDRGWIAPAWPKEYGGADMAVMDQFIMKEVFNENRAPTISVHDVGSTILVHGSEELKKQHLNDLVNGDVA